MLRDIFAAAPYLPQLRLLSFLGENWSRMMVSIRLFFFKYAKKKLRHSTRNAYGIHGKSGERSVVTLKFPLPTVLYARIYSEKQFLLEYAHYYYIP